MGRFHLSCLDCPGDNFYSFATPADRDAWIIAHKADTTHDHAIVTDGPMPDQGAAPSPALTNG